jgi:hypothetical protein
MHESVQLTVDRTQNCYGPGDRVSVAATIRSDALHTVILRGFEFTLKETTVYTAGLQGHSKKNQPQVKINIIGEQKLPVNATLYGGMTHRSDLYVHIPDSHTTTTINSAKHIDITYVLIVKALMGTGKPLIMELPVIVSNWPRCVYMSLSHCGKAHTRRPETYPLRPFGTLTKILVAWTYMLNRAQTDRCCPQFKHSASSSAVVVAASHSEHPVLEPVLLLKLQGFQGSLSSTCHHADHKWSRPGLK